MRYNHDWTGCGMLLHQYFTFAEKYVFSKLQIIIPSLQFHFQGKVGRRWTLSFNITNSYICREMSEDWLSSLHKYREKSKDNFLNIIWEQHYCSFSQHVESSSLFYGLKMCKDVFNLFQNQNYFDQKANPWITWKSFHAFILQFYLHREHMESFHHIFISYGSQLIELLTLTHLLYLSFRRMFPRNPLAYFMLQDTSCIYLDHF